MNTKIHELLTAEVKPILDEMTAKWPDKAATAEMLNLIVESSCDTEKDDLRDDLKGVLFWEVADVSVRLLLAEGPLVVDGKPIKAYQGGLDPEIWGFFDGDTLIHETWESVDAWMRDITEA